MSLGSDFKQLKELGNPSCGKCVFFRALAEHPSGHGGTCNLNPPQVVSHDGELHHIFPAVATTWYCGHFSPGGDTT